jgi:hypothetical protein
MNAVSDKRQAGDFLVDGKKIFGELSIDGINSSLRLRHDEYFSEPAASDAFIHGTLHDLVKVSLFDCVRSGTGHSSRSGQHFYFAEVFPHFVITGDQHLLPSDKTITEIHFLIDDATTLFYDFDAFGRVIRPQGYIETIAKANREIIKRDVKTGAEPEITYFTGRREIFRIDTAIGSVSAAHNPICTMGGPSGISIKNRIPVTIRFAGPVNFDTAFDGVLALVRYFELIIGRQQNVLSIGVTVRDGSSHDQYLNVNWSMAPQREVRGEDRGPHPADLLLNPVADPRVFGSVLSSYLDREPQWKTPRVRFASKLNQRYHYDVDRLIAVANIFDILPDSVFPLDPPIPDEIRSACDATRTLFEALPQSSDRDSILGALGRFGKLSLKRKIGARVKLIVDKCGLKFPELLIVTEKAVNCRNYFVHGGKQDIDYSNNYPIIWFFVDTLEFVFGVSDLIEAGWI